jgi:ABC-type antimicrobial peptide transport system permease subunit
MMGHARSLDMLILVIFAAVFVFGIFTLLSLFNDVTNRKRGTIGVMRLLGAGSRQIFIFLFVRSFLVAALAAGGSYAVGLGIAHLLEGISVDCILTLSDLQVVAAGALVCCAIGVGLPASWTIRRMEPVDAIANASVH